MLSQLFSGAPTPLASKIAVGIAFVVYLILTLLLALVLRARNDKISAGPSFVAGAMIVVVLFGLGTVIDFGAALVRGAAALPGSFLERLTFGRLSGFAPLLPLDKHPLVSAPVYVSLAMLLHLLIVPLVWWLGRLRHLEPTQSEADRRRASFDAIFWATSRTATFWKEFYDLCGYDDLRTIARSFLAWMRPLLIALPLLLLLAFFELFARERALSGFIWAAAVVLVIAGWANWLLSRKPLAEKGEAEQKKRGEAPKVGDASAWIEALRQRGFAVSATPAHTVLPREAVVRSHTTSELARARANVAMRSSSSRGVGAAGAGAGAGTSATGGGDGQGEVKARPPNALERELGEVIVGRGPLWAHQSEALSRVLEGSEHVLLATPPRSGKTVTTQLCAARVALARGKNVLFLLRDAETAAAACETLEQALSHTSWAQNLRCTQSGPELRALLSQRRSPVLTFSHPDALSAILVNHHDYALFLEYLALVVVEDVERYSGVRAPSVAFTLRRLAAVLAALRARPRVLATLGLPARNFEQYAETLLGVDLSVVAGDAAPSVAVKLHPARPPREATGDGDLEGAPLPPAAIAAAEATGLELPLALIGFAHVTDTELERASGMVTRSRGRIETVAPELAHVSIGELAGPQLARLVATHRHVGAKASTPKEMPGAPAGGGEADGAAGEDADKKKKTKSKSKDKDEEATSSAREGAAAAAGGGDDEDLELVVVAEPLKTHHEVLLAAPDPVSRWLIGDLKRAVRLAERGRRLVGETDARTLARRHALQALAERPADAEWLERRFGRTVVAQLCDENLVRSRARWRLVDEPPRLDRGRELTLAGAAPAFRSHSDTVHADPLELVDRATGTVIRRLDPGRAPIVAYPGAVLLYRGRRFAVPEDPPRYEPGESVLVDLLEEDLVSVRVRRLSLTIEDASRLRPLSLGGAAVMGGLCRVSVGEAILGSRRHRRDGRLHSVATFEPIEARYRGVARALCLPPGASEPAIHALVHLLRPALATLLDTGEQGLHVAHTVDLAGRGPALLLIDTFSGGVGYARAADVEMQKRALSLAGELLDAAFRSGEEIKLDEAVRTMRCHEMTPANAVLDAGGARTLIRKLLEGGTPDGEPRSGIKDEAAEAMDVEDRAEPVEEAPAPEQVVEATG